MNNRDAKLLGIRAATEAHRNLGIRDAISNEDISSIDIFSILAELKIHTLCRPLEGLLGVYFSKKKGILITSERKLAIQKLTAAHELGHYWMKHGDSFDYEFSNSSAEKIRADVPSFEIQAESFASEFMMPKGLIVKVAKQQGWKKSDLVYPENIYQLSLRLVTSYEATSFALYEHKLITRSELDKLIQTKRVEIKKGLLDGFSVPNFHLDIHYLTHKDRGNIIYAAPDDLILLDVGKDRLPDNHTSTRNADHYLSHVGSIKKPGKDQTLLKGNGQTTLELDEYDISIDFLGKELGLPRAMRSQIN